MVANPFKKDEFFSEREWEEELVYFLLEQLRYPSVNAWAALAVDAESRKNAALMSYQLANLALVMKLRSESVLRSVFSALLNRPARLADLSDWFGKKWVDQSRLAGTLTSSWNHGVSRETHALVA